MPSERSRICVVKAVNSLRQYRLEAVAEAQCLVDNILNESPELKTLKAARRSLSPEEKADAGDAPVWKAAVNGTTWYVVNTHRAYQAKPTVKGAAHAWHHGIEQSG